MVSYSFLYEASTPGDRFGEYTYGLTKDGWTIAKSAEEKYKDTFEKVAKIVRTCKNFCGLKAMPLSYASKIHYLLDSHESGMSFSDAVEHARQLGWDISENEVEQGTKLLGRLELVKAS